jgi:hypothetical protein
VARLSSDILKERDLAARSASAELVEGIRDLDNDARNDLDTDAVIRLGWYEVYLIQIVAGCRAIEALDAWTTWFKTGERVIRVRVRKTVIHCKVCKHIKTSKSKENGHVVLEPKGSGLRGTCKNEGCNCPGFVSDWGRVLTRLVAIPPVCLESDRELLKKTMKSRTLNAYKKYAKRHVANTHSARYCLINKMKTEGASNSTISKTTGQTEKQVEGYLNEVEAERLLMERSNALQVKA